jgi:hypothetical protein
VRARIWPVAENDGIEFREVMDRSAALDLPAIGLKLPMAELYRNVTFDPG